MTDIVKSRALRLGSRAPAVLALGLLALPLAGCSLRALSHPFGGEAAGRSESRRAPATPAGGLAEARAQAAAAPAEPYGPYHLARLYLAADSTSRAESALHQAIARDSAYAPALALLSKLDYDAGRHAEAIERLEAAQARAQRSGAAFPPTLLVDLALHEEALGHAERARALMGELPRSMREEGTSVATYLALKGDAPDSAGPLAVAAVRENPKSAANQNNYGITRLRAADLDGARRAFRAAIDIDPRLPGPYYNLAILERFYAMDDGAAARWFALYRQRSSDDPDGLVQVFDKNGKDVAQKKDEP
jgi:tetratricopeptide (TPR) repeat protein